MQLRKKKKDLSGKAEVVSPLELELRHLKKELNESDRRLDRWGAQLATKEHQTAALRLAVCVATERAETMSLSLAALQHAVQEKDATISDMADELAVYKSDVDSLKSQLRTLGGRSLKMEGEARMLSGAGTEEFQREIASLKRRLKFAEETAILQRSLNDLLKGIVTTLSAPTEWWMWIAPAAWTRRAKYRLLSRKGMFDSKLYEKRYPDVTRARMDPLQHYSAHGMEEGRLRV